MKKIKNFKLILIAGFITLSVLVSANIIKQYYIALRVEFLNHAKGQAQNFINSFIN